MCSLRGENLARNNASQPIELGVKLANSNKLAKTFSVLKAAIMEISLDLAAVSFAAF